MKILIAAAFIITITSSAFAEEVQQGKPGNAEIEPPKKTAVSLTIEEGRALYKLGFTTGMAQGAVSAAQAEAKSAFDKIK